VSLNFGLVGRRIVGVVALQATSSTGTPAQKVHLVLDNGKYFEFYGQDLQNAKGGVPCELMDPRWTIGRGYNIVQEFWGE